MNTSVTKADMRGLPKILAIDFDGTLVEDNFPHIGNSNLVMFEFCHAWKSLGGKLILWSCRTEKELSDAINFCKTTHGLEFDAVNSNITEVIKLFGEDSRKIYADYYLDDKANFISYESCADLNSKEIGQSLMRGLLACLQKKQ